MGAIDDYSGQTRTRSVVIVDDDTRVRSALRTLIDGSPELAVVGEATTPAEALEVVATADPDVVVLDMLLPQASDGLGLTRTLSSEGRVVVAISMLASLHQEALAAGAKEFLEKGGDGMTKLHETLRSVGR